MEQLAIFHLLTIGRLCVELLAAVPGFILVVSVLHSLAAATTTSFSNFAREPVKQSATWRT